MERQEAFCQPYRAAVLASTQGTLRAHCCHLPSGPKERIRPGNHQFFLHNALDVVFCLESVGKHMAAVNRSCLSPLQHPETMLLFGLCGEENSSHQWLQKGG